MEYSVLSDSTHSLDPLIHAHVRLKILSALASGQALGFRDLKIGLNTSDGNLSRHAQKLEQAGYITCQKSFQGRMPRTEYRLTSKGALALQVYVEQMERVLQVARSSLRVGGRVEKRAGCTRCMGKGLSVCGCLHVAIIMDGNGRWAKRRGLPRTAGHHAGIRSLRKTVEVAVQRQIHTLTLYAFSSDNWQRPQHEVRALMRILAAQLPAQAAHCVQKNIRLSGIGRRDRLPFPVLQALMRAEARTKNGKALHLRLALDYSARESLARAGRDVEADEFPHALMQTYNTDCLVTDVDLLIRTGGEQRLSDFLLWECAYAELYFVQEYWPDFDGVNLDVALVEFQNRQRRFGTV